MVSIQEIARSQFGQNITRSRPTQSYNAGGQPKLDYTDLTSTTLNVAIVKNYAKDEQKLEGLKQDFPAKLFGETDLDIQEFDLIKTTTETFQVENPQIKANNITGAISTDAAYFYCDLVYFDDNLIIE